MADRERPRIPTLTDVLRAAMDQRLADVHTALPGRIESYNADEQKADIKPLLKRPLVDENGDDIPSEILPIIPNVPIRFPRGGGGGSGGFFISWPLVRGDFVELHFHERSIDQWKSSQGQDTDPVDLRMHDLSDAVACPGLYPFSKSLADAGFDGLALGQDGQNQIKLDRAGNVSMVPSGAGFAHLGADSGVDFVSLAGLVDARFTALEASVIAMAAIINGNVVLYNGLPPATPHSTAPFIPVVPPATGAPTAATKGKAT